MDQLILKNDVMLALMYGSHDESECSNSLTLAGTKINDLSHYQKLGAEIPISRK